MAISYISEGNGLDDENHVRYEYLSDALKVPNGTSHTRITISCINSRNCKKSCKAPSKNVYVSAIPLASSPISILPLSIFANLFVDISLIYFIVLCYV